MSKTYAEFRLEALQSIASCTTVSLGGVSHRYLTRLVHELSYDADVRGHRAVFRFSDNSEEFGFPLGRLATDQDPPHKSERRLLRLGAMSLRHIELDFLVDAYVVLNSRISGRNLSDGEAVAKSRQMALHWYRQAARHQLWVELYHSGLTQMILGHLLALEQVLYESRRRHDSPLVVEARDIRISDNPSGLSGDNENMVLTDSMRGTRSEDYETLVVWH